jgi:hypothetical protein
MMGIGISEALPERFGIVGEAAFVVCRR